MLAALGAGAAKPALGQDLSPTFGSVNGAGIQSVSSIPDLSGVWGRNFLTFEPPSSGPGPIVSKLRRPDGTTMFSAIGDYTNPILKPEAAEIVKKFGEISMAGVTYPTPRNQCWPGGVPFVFTSGAVAILPQPDNIAIIYNYDQQVRHVRMNHPHPAHVAPSWYGDSVGHYDGDTLVIDTVGIKVGPFAMVDWYGTPHTEALHVIERYRLIDYETAKDGWERDEKENFRFGPPPNYRGKYLRLEFTVEDAGVFTTPWRATMTYGRDAAEWPEVVCAESILFSAGKDEAVPHADRPDF